MFGGAEGDIVEVARGQFANRVTIHVREPSTVTLVKFHWRRSFATRIAITFPLQHLK